MLYSMTGFGRAVVQTPGKKITVEIKSLNSKQMDLTVRIPTVLRASEADVRAAVSRGLQRGKVDVVVMVENIGGGASASLNVDAMRAYKEQVLAASEALGLPEPSDWYAVLMRMPDVVSIESVVDATDDEAAALMAAVDRAVASTMDYRAVEGKKLEAFFAERIRRIGEHLREVAPYEEERLRKIRARIEDSLAKLQGVDYDKNRFEQEMIFYIEKLDINEEKQRLAQHLEYFVETMALPEGGQGKKLGFISQEMGREINTLGSKSNQADMQILVVKMKDELEQIKEQVLNVM